jgi:hypothetical protein
MKDIQHNGQMKKDKQHNGQMKKAKQHMAKWRTLYEWGYAIFIFLTSFMTYHRVCSKSETYRVTCWWGLAYLSGAPEFTPSFKATFIYPNQLPFKILSYIHVHGYIHWTGYISRKFLIWFIPRILKCINIPNHIRNMLKSPLIGF